MRKPTTMNDRLKKFRQARCVTVKDLAHAAGTTSQNLYALERGCVPSVVTALRIAGALRTTVDELWGHLTEPAEYAGQGLA